MNEFQKDFISGLSKYCRDKIAPIVEEDDEKCVFRMEVYQGLGEYGVTGMLIPEEYSGLGLSFQDYSLALREIAKYSTSYAATCSVSTMVQSIINENGNQKQKEIFLPPLSSGQGIGAFALTESTSGSDASSLQLKAKKVPGGYALKGNKIFITSGGIAKTYVVFARTGGEGPKGISAFLVEGNAKGLSFGKLEKKMGWKISPTRELIFDNCFVPDDQLLGQEGEGFRVAMSGLDRGRIAIASIAVGLAERAFIESVKYALERKQFQQSIFDFQGIQFMLADMETEITCSKLLVEKASSLVDEKSLNTKLSAIAKLKATDMAMEVTTNAVQILGGVGYTQEFPVERLMRDAKVLQIVEGTNQIQRVVIAKQLRKEFS